MATSIHHGRILQGVDLGAESSLNTAYVRDVVFNNLAHYADEFGQVLVNWTRLGTAFDGGPSVYEFALSQTLYFGPFSLKTRQDGSPYRLRIRVAASRVSGTSTDRHFLVTIEPTSQAGNPLLTGGLNAIAGGAPNANWVLRTPVITNTFPSWQSGFTLGSTGTLDNLIEIPAGFLGPNGFLTETQTLDSVGGDPVTVGQCLAYVAVTRDPSFTPGTTLSLDGLYVAEYIGL